MKQSIPYQQENNLTFLFTIEAPLLPLSEISQSIQLSVSNQTSDIIKVHRKSYSYGTCA